MQTEVVGAWWPQTAPLSFSDPRLHGDKRGGQTFDDPERTSFNVAGGVRLAQAEVTARDTGHISCRAHCTENLTCSQSPSPGGKQCCSVGGLLRMPKAEIFSPGGPEASHLHTQGSSREGWHYRSRSHQLQPATVPQVGPGRPRFLFSSVLPRL